MEIESIEVGRYCEEACSREDNDSLGPWEDLSWQRNVPLVQPLGDEPVYLTGDVTIIDPTKIFFRNDESAACMNILQRQLQHLQQKGHWEFLVMYRGQAAYFISCESWDQDAAFEISRQGTCLGVDEVSSRFIAVVTKKMVDLLLKENGEGVKLEGGVSVKGVDGQLIRSGDGDFVISGSRPHSPVRKISRWIEDDCVRIADVLCAAGGRWTFCDDSSDEEGEDDEDSEVLESVGYCW